LEVFPRKYFRPGSISQTSTWNVRRYSWSGNWYWRHSRVGKNTSITRRAPKGNVGKSKRVQSKVQVREVPLQVYECCLHRT
jgi:hypothetical protein